MFCHWNPLACGTARGLCHTGSKMHLLFFWVLNRICSLLFHYTWIKHRKSYLQLSAISTHSAGRGFSLSCSSLNRVCVCVSWLLSSWVPVPGVTVGLAPCSSVRPGTSWAVPVLRCLAAIDKNRLWMTPSLLKGGKKPLLVPWKAFWLEHTFAYLFRGFDCHGAWQL